MAVQQSKKSKAQVRQRRSANRFEGVQGARCPSCSEACLPHRVCPHCGSYGGKQILSVTAE